MDRELRASLLGLEPAGRGGEVREDELSRRRGGRIAHGHVATEARVAEHDGVRALVEIAHHEAQRGRRDGVARHARPAQDDVLDHAVAVDRGAVLGVVSDGECRVEHAPLDLQRGVPRQIDGGQRQVQIAHVEQGAQVHGPQLHLLEAQVHQSARERREADGRARARHGREVPRIEPDVGRAPRAGGLEHPVLQLDPASGDREMIHADVEPAGGRRPVEKVGDVVAVGSEPDDPRMTAGERQTFDPDVATEQRATVKPPLEPLELRQRRPGFAIRDPEPADAELAGGEADVQRLDGDRAPGRRLQAPDRRPVDDGRQIPVESGRHQGAEEHQYRHDHKEHPTPHHAS